MDCYKYFIAKSTSFPPEHDLLNFAKKAIEQIEKVSNETRARFLLEAVHCTLLLLPRPTAIELFRSLPKRVSEMSKSHYQVFLSFKECEREILGTEFSLLEQRWINHLKQVILSLSTLRYFLDQMQATEEFDNSMPTWFEEILKLVKETKDLSNMDPSRKGNLFKEQIIDDLLKALQDYIILLHTNSLTEQLAEDMAALIEKEGFELERRPIEKTAYPSILFEMIFKKINPLMPLAAMQHARLHADRLLVENKKRFIPLTVQLSKNSREGAMAVEACKGYPRVEEEDPQSGKFSIETVFNYFHKKSQAKLLAIEGNLGTGKSLTLLWLAQKLLESPKTTKRVLPLYISMPSCKNYLEAINEYLDAQHIESKEQLLELQKTDILVFLDGMDELFPSKERSFDPIEDIPKIIMNGLKCLPNARFVISYRNAFLGNLKLEFDSLLATLSPFSDKQLTEYIKKHLDICKKNNIPTPWTVDLFFNFLHQYTKYREQVKIPIYARIMVETLPHTSQWIQSQKGRYQGSVTPEIELLDADFCLTVERELKRLKSHPDSVPIKIDQIKKTDYLNYNIELAKLFHDLSNSKINLTEIASTTRTRVLPDGICQSFDLNTLKGKSDLFEGQKNQMKIRCSPLVKDANGNYTFKDNVIFSYFLSLINPIRRREVEARLMDGDSKFAAMINYPPT